MSVLKASNFGNPHLGLFARASEKFVAADISSSPKLISALSNLRVPVLQATFGGSGLAAAAAPLFRTWAFAALALGAGVLAIRARARR